MDMELWFMIGGAIAIIASLVLCRVKPGLGLILSPFLSIAAGICFSMSVSVSSSYGNTTSLFEPPSTAIIVLTAVFSEILSLVLLLTARILESESKWPRSIAKTVFAILGILVGMALFTGLLGPMGTLLGLFFFALIIRYLVIARKAWATHVFSFLNAAVRQHLPLTVAMEAEAIGFKSKPRNVFRRINYWLIQGHPLSEALRRGYPQCPGFALAQVAAAEKINQLPHCLAQIEEQLSQHNAENRTVQPVNPFYPFAIIFFACLMLFLMGWKLAPVIKMLLLDSGIKMPALTQWLIGNMPEPIMITPFVLFLVAIIWMYVLFRPRDPRHPKLLSRIGDFFKWHCPITSWFDKKMSTLQVVSFIRLSLSADNRVDIAITDATGLDTNLCYRRKLRNWLKRVESGEDIAAAARASGVGSGLAWAFDQAANPGQTPQVLEMLESAYRSAYSYKANIVRYIFWPCVIVSLAIFVGVIVVGAFLPLVSIIQANVQSCTP